jgi:hypothetical protein
LELTDVTTGGRIALTRRPLRYVANRLWNWAGLFAMAVAIHTAAITAVFVAFTVRISPWLVSALVADHVEPAAEALRNPCVSLGRFAVMGHDHAGLDCVGMAVAGKSEVRY